MTRTLHEHWDGIWFGLDRELPSDGFELRTLAASYEWSSSWLGKKHASFCTPELPHEAGLLDLDDGDAVSALVWAPSGGSVILTVRFDSRSVNKHDLQVAMDRLAREKLGRPLSQIGGRARREFREEVEAQLLKAAPLRPRVIEVLVTGRRAFALRLPPAEIDGFRKLMFRAFGVRFDVDPVIWPREDGGPPGFFEISTGVLSRVVERESLAVEPDIRLIQARLGSELIRLQTRDSETGLSFLSQARRENLEVKSISLEVEMEERVEVCIEPSGLTFASAPHDSAGGLPFEIAQARWAQLDKVVERVQEFALELRTSSYR